jgi:hypothetical protein
MADSLFGSDLAKPKAVDYYLELACRFELQGKLPQAELAFRAALKHDEEVRKDKKAN